MKIKIFLSFALALAIIGLFTANSFAEDSSSSGMAVVTPKPSFAPGLIQRRPVEDSASTKSGTPRLILGLDKLKTTRLAFCQNHQAEINTRLTSLSNLVTNILGKFDAIATRVEQFYTNKVIPSGRSVPNYDELKADITTKSDAVQAALTKAQDDVKNFDCSGDNPKGQIGLFKTDMQAVKKALQNYKISIKNLIVAVKSVVGETQKESPKPESSESANLKTQ